MSLQTESRPATGEPPAADFGAEREIDLREIWGGIRRQWWVVAAGVVVGIVLGGLYSLSGGSSYEATAQIAPGQAFSPGGDQVLRYLTNPAAIHAIATSPATIAEASAKAGIPAGQLRGNVTTEAVNSEGTPTQRQAVLVEITVHHARRVRAEAAANAIADVVRRATTSRYVRQSLAIYDRRIANYNARLQTLQKRIEFLNRALVAPGLTLNESLLLAIQLDQAQGIQGQTIDSLTQTQQQKILAEDVQRTQIVQEARAVKTSARSRRTSILVGAVLGLIGGLVAALVVDRRASGARPA
jgi:uncharacterized protein involved in exopolysaccharide biosynthesis